MRTIRLLGGASILDPGVIANGRVVQRTRIAVLALLALSRTHSASRESLMARLWPESDSTRARHLLRESLYRLRETLGDDALVSAGDEIRLDSEQVACDVWDFEAAVTRQDWAGADRLYAGPLLDGFFVNDAPDFERWVDGERARLEDLHARALESLAVEHAERGDWIGAVGLWRRRAVADPHNGRVALRLMEALDAAGDRSAALKHATVHVELLKSDLGAAPDPAVAALAERLRRDPAARTSARTDAVRVGHGAPDKIHRPLYDAAPSDQNATPRPAADDRREHANFARVLTSSTLGGDVGAGHSAESRHGRALATRVVAWTCGIGVSIAGLAFGITMSRRSTADTLVRFSVDLGAGLRLAAGPAPLALAPDGRTLAFVANREDGEPRLFVRSLAEMRPRECAGTEGASQPFFSPNGQWIGFYAGGYLKKVSAAGGEPRIIGPVQTMRGAAWGTNDLIVVSTAGSLGVIPAAGGPVRRISLPDTSSREIAQRWPMILRDGTILYTASGRILEESRIAVLSPDGRRRQVLDLSGTAPVGLLDGYMLYVSARNPGTETNTIMAVAWDTGKHRATGAATTVVDDVAIDVQGAAAAAISPNGSLAYVLRSGIRRRVIIADDRGGRHVLTASPGAYAFPRFSPDGKRIALNLVGPPFDNEVRVLDRASGALTPLTANRAGYPEWTPDGKRILYLRPPGNGGLWWRSVDLSSPDSLILRNDSLDVKEGVLSRDGATLVVRVNNIRTYARELWFRLMSGDTVLRPLVRDNALNAGPRISPDGRWVAYGSSELGNAQVYVVPLTGNAPRHRISTDRGWAPMWSPDGRRLYYVRGKQLIEAKLRFAPSFEVSSRRVVLDGGFDSQQAYHAHYDVSLNGELVFVEDVSAASPVVFVQGWTRELAGRGTLVLAK